eukprot:gene10538-12308_t
MSEKASGRASLGGRESESAVGGRKSVVKHVKNEELSSAYDYVMVFPMEKSAAGGFQQTPTAKYAVSEMNKAGLETFSYLSIQDDELIVLVRCPAAKLREFADEIDFKLELDPEVVKESLRVGQKDVEKGDGSYKIRPVVINDSPVYSPLNPYENIYGRYEQNVGDSLYLIPEGEASPFNKQIRLKLIYYILRAPHNQGGCGLEVTRMIFKKTLLSIFPLHERGVCDQIVHEVARINVAPWQLPLEDIRQYFGEKIALYNVFIGHYSHWLLIPGLIGLVFQLVVWGTGNYSHPVLPFYSLVVCVWSILMLEYWKRQESFTAMQWGMSEFEQEEPVRPEFKGHPIKSFIDGRDTLYFPPEEQMDNMAGSGSVVGAYMLLVLGVVASIYVLRFSIEHQVGTNASTIASILNTIQITVFNYIYRGIVVKLTDYENPRTDTIYEDSLIMKLFVFQFVNSYASFFFLAFIASNLATSDAVDDDTVVGQCGAATCMTPLSINLAIIFGVRLTVTNFLDIFIPYVNYKMKVRKETAGVEDKSRLTPAEQDFMLTDYNGMLNGIENYADTAIQYGFSVLFVVALPCAAFFSLVSNYFKVKLNIWKLATFYQRPVPQGAQDIGTWMSIFQFLSIAAVVTNAGLICFTMDVLDQYTSLGRTWLFIGFQWTLIMVQVIVTAAVHDVPPEVEIQLARQAFIRSKLLDKIEDDDVEDSEVVEVDQMAGVVSPADTGNMLCCRKKKAKYLDRKKNMNGAPDVVVKQYPILANGGNSAKVNPMTQHLRSEH